MHDPLMALTKIGRGRTHRESSWDRSGRNADRWIIAPGETRVLADVKGAGCFTHIWMTQSSGYRDVLIRVFWDGEKHPSVLVPLGDFFGLGNEIVNSYQSLLFTASTGRNNRFNEGCALNSYVRMPFAESARIELVNEGRKPHLQYFYVDYEVYDEPLPPDAGRFHAQFRRENPCDGWGHEIQVNVREADIVNKGRTAWDGNYLILDAKGTGHYIGCNLSVANFQGTWWGEGDDMIWVDGYAWPPRLHGTGSEDYLNQAWGMQDNAFLRNGSSIFEGNTDGYQTSYVFHLENPVRFQEEIRVTIEHGHGNHLANEMASVAYWYQTEPHVPFGIVPAARRKPVLREHDHLGRKRWLQDPKSRTRATLVGRRAPLNAEMRSMKKRWARGRRRG